MRELLVNRAKALTATREQLMANLHAVAGAMQEVNDLLAYMDKNDVKEETHTGSGLRHPTDLPGPGAEAEAAPAS